MTYSTSLTIRLAREDDRASLATLAQLDSGRAPAHPVLLAEADGGVEDARTSREFLHLARDDAEAVLVAGTEHLRLRAPLVST